MLAVTTELVPPTLGCIAFMLVIRVGNLEFSFRTEDRFSLSLRV